MISCKNIFIYFILIFLVSCSNKNPNDSIEYRKIEFAVNKGYTLNLDSLTFQYSPSTQYYRFKDYGDCFVFLNQGLNCLEIYSLETGSLIRRIRYSIEGSNGVGFLEGFYIHNEDTIVVQSRYQISYVDLNSTTLFKWDFLKNSKETITALPRIELLPIIRPLAGYS
jgi:hypothetical protein